MPDGSMVDLRQLTAIVSCGKTVCSDSDLDAETEERPWGRNNPRWQLYASGPIDAMVPDGSGGSSAYLVVWMADDSSENDGMPRRDGDEEAGENPGRGRLSMLARAYGPAGVLRAIEATIARGDARLRVLSWREIR